MIGNKQLLLTYKTDYMDKQLMDQTILRLVPKCRVVSRTEKMIFRTLA